jgi:hypothetical protein
MKKRLSPSEEFDIMKLVLDKFLWLGTAIMGFGIYQIFTGHSFQYGITIIVSGAIVLLLFLLLIVKEYEIVK